MSLGENHPEITGFSEIHSNIKKKNKLPKDLLESNVSEYFAKS